MSSVEFAQLKAMRKKLEAERKREEEKHALRQKIDLEKKRIRELKYGKYIKMGTAVGKSAGAVLWKGAKRISENVERQARADRKKKKKDPYSILGI